MANVKSIAKLAGVSVTTVSRVLNNHPYVNEATRQKVQHIMEKEGYRPNSSAVHLIKGHTDRVGVIVPNNHPYFQAILSGVMDEAAKSGYGTLLYQSRYETQEEHKALQLLSTKQIDGLLFCSRALELEAIAAYAKYGPIVTCEYTENEQIAAVYTDHYEAFQKGIQYLIQHGHRAIGYCVGRPDSASSQARYLAYKTLLHEQGEVLHPEWIFTDCTEIKDGIRVIDTLMKMEERPTALLVTGDEAAAGVILRAQALGLRIPEDLAIIGFDNLPISEALGLTTIDQHLQEIGREAFRTFYNSRNVEVKDNAPSSKTVIPFELVERSSV
ncbi:LacI family DNA-binding transcriptional regulator [Paenibacillus sp. PDC88]|uniref:LacI family DNA-binding transcriptional regulator n=1 Tax=Paenibacillus sp. PDC88 TaxID=1884375 RepID=UPI00089B5050|nr:LacI family DNA-binding transcriptional regulator [Paenibacillus sp. PDC88]SDX21602.1 transcriptional regulator, LacI family [Paenibacillus sp. PDC88]